MQSCQFGHFLSDRKCCGRGTEQVCVGGEDFALCRLLDSVRAAPRCRVVTVEYHLTLGFFSLVSHWFMSHPRAVKYRWSGTGTKRHTGDEPPEATHIDSLCCGTHAVYSSWILGMSAYTHYSLRHRPYSTKHTLMTLEQDGNTKTS